jgi:hypothetical protein
VLPQEAPNIAPKLTPRPHAPVEAAVDHGAATIKALMASKAANRAAERERATAEKVVVHPVPDKKPCVEELPAGWTVEWSKSRAKWYFFNKRSKEARWRMPTPAATCVELEAVERDATTDSIPDGPDHPRV